jgi:hypothetical protein
MTDYPAQHPDPNPASGWPPPAQPGAAGPEQRDQPDQGSYGTGEPPTRIAPSYPASPAYPPQPASPAYPPQPASPAYPPQPASPAAYPASPPSDPYAQPVYAGDPYATTTPYPQPPPAAYPPAYGYGTPAAAPPNSGAATASLVLGITGLVVGWCACGLPSLLAIIFGHIGLNQTRNNLKGGRGQALAGLIMGYVLIVPTVLVTLSFGGGLLTYMSHRR